MFAWLLALAFLRVCVDYCACVSQCLCGLFLLAFLDVCIDSRCLRLRSSVVVSTLLCVDSCDCACACVATENQGYKSTYDWSVHTARRGEGVGEPPLIKLYCPPVLTVLIKQAKN